MILLQARRDILGGQLVAVVEFDVVADLEGPGLAVVGRLRHFGAQIAHDVGCRSGLSD